MFFWYLQFRFISGRNHFSSDFLKNYFLLFFFKMFASMYICAPSVLGTLEARRGDQIPSKLELEVIVIFHGNVENRTRLLWKSNLSAVPFFQPPLLLLLQHMCWGALESLHCEDFAGFRSLLNSFASKFVDIGRNFLGE